MLAVQPLGAVPQDPLLQTSGDVQSLLDVQFVGADPHVPLLHT